LLLFPDTLCQTEAQDGPELGRITDVDTLDRAQRLGDFGGADTDTSEWLQNTIISATSRLSLPYFRRRYSLALVSSVSRMCGGDMPGSNTLGSLCTRAKGWSFVSAGFAE
jgi:hypothetical protein